MQIILERVDGKVRASSGAPMDIKVEAPDEEGALAVMLAEVSLRLQNGTKIVEIPMPQAATPDDNPWLAIHGIFRDEPSFDEWQSAITEYRNEVNAEVGPW